MPQAPQAIARFPGVVSVIGGTFTWGHGETPGVCLLNITPQEKPPQLIGTLTIEYDNTKIELKDCRVVDASYRRDSSGKIVSLTIEDWRWQWRDRGLISGRYNLRDGDGKIIAHTEKSPRQLAKLCFDAMGQKEIDTYRMPDDSRPQIEWDVANPAQALSALAELLGCRIAPGFENTAKVVKLGVGNELPREEDSGLVDLNDVLDPPERPDALMVVGGPAEFQHDFELEAVALEPSGEYVPLEEASYKPAGGWGMTDHDQFQGIPTEDLKSRALALESVFRAYRIKIPDDGLYVPGYTEATGKKVKRMDQLEILDRQCVQVVQLGEKQFQPPLVYGAYTGDGDFGPDAFANTVQDVVPITDLESDLAKVCPYRRGFKIDRKRGVVILAAPVVMTIDEETELSGPAELRLRVAVNIRDEDTGGILRHTRERRYTPDKSKQPKIIRRDELVARTIPIYKPGSTEFEVLEVTDNLEEVDKEADYYLDREEESWRVQTPAEATYARIVPYSPDGVLYHVVWSFGNSRGAFTKLGYNTEVYNYITPYKERRLNANMRVLASTNVPPKTDAAIITV